MTRDFETTRDHIHRYEAELTNGWKLTVVPEGKDCSAMVERSEAGDRLLITKGNRYASTGRGNYCGDPLGENELHLAFTLIPERTKR